MHVVPCAPETDILNINGHTSTKVISAEKQNSMCNILLRINAALKLADAQNALQAGYVKTPIDFQKSGNGENLSRNVAFQ